ncbi:hypothetical protein COV11_03575 [Candidatus Woesearchaeota archaeon CG10_big_fil_rev_8_21_14_0_10_30_7]|nr:MAG: hypothetical protein COV11_03575 [Candidatus Woesearchaeota archaeon CG10_big_fil_rev_8_21_14_0_10_30_7]
MAETIVDKVRASLSSNNSVKFLIKNWADAELNMYWSLPSGDKTLFREIILEETNFDLFIYAQTNLKYINDFLNVKSMTDVKIVKKLVEISNNLYKAK